MSMELGKTANNMQVVVNWDTTAIKPNLAKTLGLLDSVIEALPEHEIRGDRPCFTHDFGRAIGHTALVETRNNDRIMYAIPAGTERYARYVLWREPAETSLVTVVLKRLQQNNYNLWNAWLGPLLPPTPDVARPDCVEASKEFWRHHAFVFDETDITPGTTRTRRPWRDF